MVYDAIVNSGAQGAIQFYVIASLLSAFAFLYLGKRWKGKVPRKFVYLHFFVASWSGIMYLNFLEGFRTVVSDFTWYVDWGVSTPLMVTALGLTAFYRSDKIEWDLIGALAGTQAMLIVMGLLAQTAETATATLTFFGIGLLILLRIFYLIFSPILTAARQNSRAIYGKYKILGLYIMVFWMGYPTVWALGLPGLQILNAHQTSLIYIAMHTICKYGFGFLNLFLIYKLSEEVEKPVE